MNFHPEFRVRTWSFPRRAFFALILTLVPLMIKNFFRFRAIGLENVIDYPEGTSVIFAGNHRSHLDALILGTALVPHRRYFASIAPAKSMKQNPLFRVTRLLGAFPLDNRNPEPALRYFLESLKADLALFIFPQAGRIARTPIQDYQILHREGRTGVGRLVLRTNGQIPVIPFYIHNSAEALGIGQRLPRFKAYISVTFGEPMVFSQFTKPSGWREDEEFYASARKIVDRIMVNIRELLISTEDVFFSVLRKHIKEPLETVDLSRGRERKVRRLVSKIVYYSPEELRELVKKS